MPFLAPIIAGIGAVISAVGTAVATVGTVISTVTGLGTAFASVAGFVASGAIVAGLSVGLAALTSPRVGAAGGGSLTQFAAGTNEGIPFAAGAEVGIAGRIIHRAVSGNGDDNAYQHIFVVSSLGPGTYEEHWVEETQLTVTAGAVTTSPWSGLMWITTKPGTASDTFLPNVTGAGSITEWTSQHTLPDLLCKRWMLKGDQDNMPGVPSDPYDVVGGPPVYDPREDSTQPGGSGSQRADDETTWTNGGRSNAWLQLLSYQLGFRRGDDNDVQVGLGVDPDLFRYESYMDAANAFEAASWSCALAYSTADEPAQVMKALAQCGGGEVIMLGAYNAVFASVAGVSVGTFTAADIRGDVSIPAMPSFADRINGIWPSYVSIPHHWKVTPADAAVVIEDYVTEDGGLYTKPVSFPAVTDVDQMAQLAALGIYDSREIGPIELPLDISWAGVEPGDVITGDAPEYLLDEQDFRVLKRTIDFANGIVVLTVRTENGDKYAEAMAMTGEGLTPPTLSSGLKVPDAPSATLWSAEGAQFAGATDAIAAIVITRGGPIENLHSAETVVEYRPSDSGDEGAWSPGPPDLSNNGRFELAGQLTSGTDYDISLRYRVRGVLSERLIIEDVTAGDYDFGGSPSADVTPDAINWGNISASGSDPTSGTNGAQSVTGINQVCTFTVTFTGSGATIYYRKNGGSYVSISSGGTLTVANGDSVDWKATRSGSSGTSSGTVTVVNTTNGGASIDTFTYSVEVSASDVTPTPINWTNISASAVGIPVTGTTSTETVSGINTTITLKVTFVEYLGTWDLDVSVAGGAPDSLVSGDTFTVTNGQTVQFTAGIAAGVSAGEVIVTNVSDGDVELDRFTVSLVVDS